MTFTKSPKSKPIVYIMRSMYLFFILTMLVCGGCVKYVDIPVWVCPKPNIPIRQELKYLTVNKSDLDATLTAFIYDIKYLEAYSLQLETLLKAYSKQDVTK